MSQRTNLRSWELSHHLFCCSDMGNGKMTWKSCQTFLNSNLPSVLSSVSCKGNGDVSCRLEKILEISRDLVVIPPYSKI